MPTPVTAAPRAPAAGGAVAAARSVGRPACAESTSVAAACAVTSGEQPGFKRSVRVHCRPPTAWGDVLLRFHGGGGGWLAMPGLPMADGGDGWWTADIAAVESPVSLPQPHSAADGPRTIHIEVTDGRLASLPKLAVVAAPDVWVDAASGTAAVRYHSHDGWGGAVVVRDGGAWVSVEGEADAAVALAMAEVAECDRASVVVLPSDAAAAAQSSIAELVSVAHRNGVSVAFEVPPSTSQPDGDIGTAALRLCSQLPLDALVWPPDASAAALRRHISDVDGATTGRMVHVAPGLYDEAGSVNIWGCDWEARAAAQRVVMDASGCSVDMCELAVALSARRPPRRTVTPLGTPLPTVALRRCDRPRNHGSVSLSEHVLGSAVAVLLYQSGCPMWSLSAWRSPHCGSAAALRRLVSSAAFHHAEGCSIRCAAEDTLVADYGRGATAVVNVGTTSSEMTLRPCWAAGYGQSGASMALRGGVAAVRGGVVSVVLPGRSAELLTPAAANAQPSASALPLAWQCRHSSRPPRPGDTVLIPLWADGDARSPAADWATAEVCQVDGSKVVVSFGANGRRLGDRQLRALQMCAAPLRTVASAEAARELLDRWLPLPDSSQLADLPTPELRGICAAADICAGADSPDALRAAIRDAKCAAHGRSELPPSVAAAAALQPRDEAVAAASRPVQPLWSSVPAKKVWRGEVVQEIIAVTAARPEDGAAGGLLLSPATGALSDVASPMTPPVPAGEVMVLDTSQLDARTRAALCTASGPDDVVRVIDQGDHHRLECMSPGVVCLGGPSGLPYPIVVTVTAPLQPSPLLPPAARPVPPAPADQPADQPAQPPEPAEERQLVGCLATAHMSPPAVTADPPTPSGGCDAADDAQLRGAQSGLSPSVLRSNLHTPRPPSRGTASVQIAEPPLSERRTSDVSPRMSIGSFRSSIASMESLFDITDLDDDDGGRCYSSPTEPSLPSRTQSRPDESPRPPPDEEATELQRMVARAVGSATREEERLYRSLRRKRKQGAAGDGGSDGGDGDGASGEGLRVRCTALARAVWVLPHLRNAAAGGSDCDGSLQALVRTPGGPSAEQLYEFLRDDGAVASPLISGPRSPEDDGWATTKTLAELQAEFDRIRGIGAGVDADAVLRAAEAAARQTFEMQKEKLGKAIQPKLRALRSRRHRCASLRPAGGGAGRAAAAD